MATGYLHPDYAIAQKEVGEPVFLRRSGGTILRRRIPGTDYHDGIGTYPIFCCTDWSGLREDMQELAPELASLILVADPLGDYPTQLLPELFPDQHICFKQHYIVDLHRCSEESIAPHHKRNTRKAARMVQVERVATPSAHHSEWCSLYQHITARHRVAGIARFSDASFAIQLRLPGMHLFRARSDDVTIGMVLWVEIGDRVYYHLAAYNDVGYDLGASFVLFDFSLKFFRSRGTHVASLGGVAGLSDSVDVGLARFKKGWANRTVPAYLCGKIFDHRAYNTLSGQSDESSFFPRYRTPAKLNSDECPTL